MWPAGAPSMEDARRAYEAKRALDALDATYDVTNRARAVSSAANDAWSAVASALNGGGGGASSVVTSGGGGAGAGGGGRRWTCHACERVAGGGRGEMVSGTIVQPAGVPMAMLEIKGEVVERAALPMGKDELVKGEMIAFGKWMARVVGVEGATPEPPRVLVRPPSAEDEARERAVRAQAAAAAVPPAVPPAVLYGGRQPLVVETPALATQPRAGGIEAPGARREYYHDPNGRPQTAHQPSHQPPPRHEPRYQIYEPAPRFERGVDPDTGERERWMAGGWRGRSNGSDRPRAVTQQEVEAARARLLQLEQEARIRAEVAAAEALARQQQAEAARLSAQTALEQMSQAEAANRAVREAEWAAAEAKRLAYFAAENQREAESQFISMLPLDGAETAIEAQNRVSELDELQRRIAEHERAANAHAIAPSPTMPQQYVPQQQQYTPPQPQYAPQQPQYAPQQPQYAPQQQQYAQQPQYAPPQPQREQPQYEPPQQRHERMTPVSVQFTSPRQTTRPQVERHVEAEVEYTTSPSNVKERAAAFGHVTIKPKPTSPAVNPSAQTYSNMGTSSTSASAHALAQVIREGRPQETGAETAEELKRKIAIMQRLARSRGLIA